MLKFLRSFLKDEEDELAILREKFSHFRRLLESNNQALAAMADMEEKLTGDFLFDTGYLHNQVENLSGFVREMIDALICLSQDRYQELNLVYQKLQEDILQELIAIPEIPQTPYIFFLDQLNREMAASSGGKMANLGEIRNRLRLPTPPGFVITAAAYQHFLEGSGLSKILETKLQEADITDLVRLEAVSQELQDLVRQATLPADQAQAITEAVRIFGDNYISVRSSAVGEDTEFSFAGQFATLLNVSPDEIIQHYKEVVASKFTSRAIFYWKYKNFSLKELPMAVGCLEMVPAQASGVMFSVDPHAPEKKSIVITAVWGLGKFAVDGSVSPDIFELSKEDNFSLIQKRLGNKNKALVMRPQGSAEEIPLTPEKAATPCLNEAQLRVLAAIAVQLEQHFNGPQDIEWAVDNCGQIILLQSRPLRISEPTFQNQMQEKPEIVTTPLLDHGVRAVGGAAGGPVFVLQREEDIPGIPPGAVVVVRQPSSRLVQVMDRIAAILTEVGSPTDHMTILAREFRVPTLVDVTGVLETLATGQQVTVDADLALVYPGIIPELLTRDAKKPEPWRDDPVFAKLKGVLKYISPLHLLDPASPDFSTGSCRSLHDITRFCHEKAMDAMFNLDIEQSVQAKGISRLQSDLPLNLFILDLGGGLKDRTKKVICEEDFTACPFRAVLRGFRNPEVRWAGQVSVDFKGFMSVFANTLYDMNKSETGLGGKSFAIITDKYLNFNSRLGYHFGLLDAYVSEERNDNYISFQFKGGAASLDRRERRAQLLAMLLDDMGFKAQAVSDLVRGRLVKYSREDTEKILEQVGTLLAFSRQLDLALSSDAVMNKIFYAFKNGDFGLESLQAENEG
jgi:pyruvate, water dikinase